ARLKSANDLGSPLLTQAIAVRLLTAIDQIRVLRRRQLKPRRDLMARLLGESLPDWKFRLPSGGLFLWVKLPSGDSREFAQVALRHGTLVLPGPTMSAGEQHAAFIRLPYLAEEEILRAGVRRLSAAWREYQPASRRDPRPNIAIVCQLGVPVLSFISCPPPCSRGPHCLATAGAMEEQRRIVAEGQYWTAVKR